MTFSVRLLSTFLFCLIFNSSFSQSEKAIWGDIPQQDFDSKTFEKYDGQDAVIISSYGEYFVTAQSKTLFTQHFRVKILSKKGLRFANVRIEDDYFDDLTVEASSYNLENGEVVESPLDSANIFRKEHVVNFAIPNVKVGSIIEYRYTLEAEYRLISPTWYFQSTIPVIRSEFYLKRFSSPYAGYTVMLEGARLVKKYGDATKKTKSWVLHNIPALPQPDYLPNLKDYFNKLRFIILWDTPKTWNGIAREFKEHRYFGEQLRSSKAIKQLLEGFITEEQTPQQKMTAIFNYCQQQFTWDGYYSKYLDYDNIKKNLNAEEQSSGSINLLMLTMLKQADLEANPVLLSTRSNGKVFDDIVLKTQFNHTIVSVELDNQTYLLDAVAKTNTIHTLPIADLNGKGLQLKKGKAAWVPLQTSTKHKVVSSWSIDLSNLAKPSYKVIYKYNGLPKNQIQTVLAQKGENEFIKSKLKTVDVNLDSSQITPLDANTPSLGLSYYFSTTDQFDEDDERIYLEPIMAHGYAKNPFVNPKRALPVRFSYPYKKQFVTSITLPTDYTVEELPESTRIELPNKMMSFSYQSKVVGNRLQVIALIQLKQTEISAKDYQLLKTFYDRMIEKLNATVVLKKVDEE